MNLRGVAQKIGRAGKQVANTATAGAVDAVEDLVENKGKEEEVSKAEFDWLCGRVDRLIEDLNEHHKEIRKGLRKCLRKIRRLEKDKRAS